jgi:nucleoside-diphosphate-sugar epimerase
MASTQYYFIEHYNDSNLSQRNCGPMKILVTGGLGFIGHRVVAELECAGHDVVITDTRTGYGIIPQAEIDWLIAERKKAINTDRIYTIDIADRDGMSWLLRMHRPDIVIHLASFPRQKVVNVNPQWGSRSMSEGLLNLLEASSQNQVQKFVYISSSMVYGDFQDITGIGVLENHATNPRGQYGIMKLAGEWLTRDYTQRTGMAHVIIRPSAVYGPLDVEDRVVSKFLITAMRRGIIQVNGGNESLDFTYVDDLARGIAQAAVSEKTLNNTYNITRGRARTLQEAAKLVIDIAQGGSMRINEADASFPTRGTLNTQRAALDFGYKPRVDIEQGFRTYYEWLNNSIYRSQKTV